MQNAAVVFVSSLCSVSYALCTGWDSAVLIRNGLRSCAGDNEDPASKRQRGRPKGSKNRRSLDGQAVQTTVSPLTLVLKPTISRAIHSGASDTRCAILLARQNLYVPHAGLTHGHMSGMLLIKLGTVAWPSITMHGVT